MQFYKETDNTYSLNNLSEDQMFDLYSILAFVGRSKNILANRVTDDEYNLSKEVSELMARFIDDEVYLILEQGE